MVRGVSSAQAAVAALKNIVRPAYHGWQWLYHGWQSLVVRLRGKRNLAAVKRDLEQRAPGLILDVSETDEMFRYGVYLEGSAEGSLARYYREGETLCNDLSRALERNGLTLEDAHSVLDFACGYGRVTRWLVIRCGADRVAASDIDPKAVAFVRGPFRSQRSRRPPTLASSSTSSRIP